MSIYPNINNPTDVFNPDDFDNNDLNENDDDDLSEYLKKTGDTMTGPLILTNLTLNGVNQQSFSLTNKNDLNENTNKLQGVTKLSNPDYTFINDLKVDQIQFMNAQQNQAFTNNDKLQIYTNRGNITNNTSKLLPFTTLSDRVILSKKLWFNDVGSIDTYGGVLRIDSNQSTPIALDPGPNQWLSLYANTVNIGRDDFGRIYMNGEAQNHCYTDTDHGHVNSIPALSTQVTTNTNHLTQIDNTLTQLSGQIRTPYITHIPLTLNDMLNITSIPNGQPINISHNFNIGKALYETYGLPNDFYYDGLWKSHKTFELCFTGKFTSNNSEIYNLQTGFRNIHKDTNVEHASTSYTIDCGYESVQNSSSSFRESIRYNSGMVYVVGRDALYGSHYFYLHTKLHIQAPLSGIVDLKGVLTVKVY